jgi:short-subunit dehydrogenase
MKTVLITGANSGFGYLTALTFARNGYKVYATARSLDKDGVKEMNEIVKNENLSLQWLVLDITNNAQIIESTKDIQQLDVLVNNAGFGLVGPIEGYSEEEFLTQIDTNLLGAHRLIKRFIPVMKKQKSGKIVNIASIAGKITFPYYGLYSASKFGLEAYTEVLRSEVRSFGIDVCLVEPGTFKTGFSSRIVEAEDSILKDYSYLTKKIEGTKNFLNSFGFLKFKSNPQKVADRVFQISQRKMSMLHNYVGSDSKILAIVRKIIPDNIWDLIVQVIVK